MRCDGQSGHSCYSDHIDLKLELIRFKLDRLVKSIFYKCIRDKECFYSTTGFFAVPFSLVMDGFDQLVSFYTVHVF